MCSNFLLQLVRAEACWHYRAHWDRVVGQYQLKQDPSLNSCGMQSRQTGHFQNLIDDAGQEGERQSFHRQCCRWHPQVAIRAEDSRREIRGPQCGRKASACSCQQQRLLQEEGRSPGQRSWDQS